MRKGIGIIGASGWLGRELTKVLEARGVKVIGFSRSPKKGWRQWDTCSVPDLSGLDVVINLAGEAIDQRWTDGRKKRFHESRATLTHYLTQGIAASEVTTFLNSSAVGYYGDRGDEKLTEESGPGDNYLAKLCVDWEVAAAGVEARTVFLRTGIVLGQGGRAWEKLRKVFGLGIGGKLGNGQQWMPWIHLQDEIAAIVHCLEHEISGPVNLVAPGVVKNAAFTRELAAALHRPAFFPAPSFALKLALGDFAKEGLLASQRVIPEILLETGYEFQFSDLRSAFSDLVAK